MKILHISTADTRGAGLCAYRIHKTLLDMGLESKMIVMEKKHNDSDVVKVFKIRSFFFRAFHRLLRLLHLYIYEYDQLIRQSKQTGYFYSRPISYFDLSSNTLVKEADIIHLHWVDNFFDVPSFLRKINKPIVWTLHDEGLFCGTAHYCNEAILCDPIERKYKKIKEVMIVNRENTGIAFLSKYFYREFYDNPVVSGCKMMVINNSVDSEKFGPHDKEEARRMLKISNEKIVFSFIAARIDDPRKGLEKLIKALQLIQNSKMMILAIGNATSFAGNDLVLTTGSINSSEDISKVLSASDFFVMPSQKEAFAQTPLEAMACGIPVIVTPVSGTDELINDYCGVRCEGFEAEDLVKAIDIAFKTQYDRNRIIKYVKNNFSPQTICKQYIGFYNSMFNN